MCIKKNKKITSIKTINKKEKIKIVPFFDILFYHYL
jgi:hypothetical protein